MLVTLSGVKYYGTAFRIAPDLLLTNHHVLFDLGALGIERDLGVRDRVTGVALGRLRRHPRHALNAEALDYRRRMFE